MHILGQLVERQIYMRATLRESSSVGLGGVQESGLLTSSAGDSGACDSKTIL